MGEITISLRARSGCSPARSEDANETHGFAFKPGHAATRVARRLLKIE